MNEGSSRSFTSISLSLARFASSSFISSIKLFVWARNKVK